MSDISTIDFRHALNAAISSKFPDAALTEEELSQSVTSPSFHMKLQEPGHVQELGRRYLRTYPVLVSFYDPAAGTDELYGIADELTNLLMLVLVKDRPVRGTAMRFDIVDGILLFQAEYKLHVWAARSSIPAMQALDTQEAIK